jgi:hypothetical protein
VFILKKISGDNGRKRRRVARKMGGSSWKGTRRCPCLGDRYSEVLKSEEIESFLIFCFSNKEATISMENTDRMVSVKN